MKNICITLIASGAMLMVIGAKTTAMAATYHVPSDYGTIEAAYEACNPGDTVIVANGTYITNNQADVLRLDKSGTAGNPITIEATNIGGAILDGQGIKGSDNYESVVYITGDYNVVQGFEIKRGYDGGVDIWGSHNQVLLCNIHNNGDFGNTNLDNGLCGINDQPNTADNSYVGNYIHANGRISQGLNLDHGIYLQGTNNELVANNLIIGNCAYGIQVAAVYNMTNIEIYNNTIVSNLNRGGIVLWGNGGAMNGVDIANNIICSNAEPGIVTSSCTGSGVQLRNNLFYDNSNGGGTFTGTTWIMNNNGSTVSYTASGNITNMDPEFVNSASDWHLQKCSPAVDSELTLNTVTNDFDGLPRPIPFGGAYDIGAYER